MATEAKNHTAQCFCGAVELTLAGEPVAMGYCHCESCRHWSAGPVNAFSLWPKDAVKITRGEDKLGRYAKTPASERRWCTQCGGHVMTGHPHWGLVDVYAAVIEDFDFAPGVHVHYQETVLPMHDGVPKLKDLPKEMGGSGVAIAE
ncbi:MAG TPA: GFA family protein [Rhodanobacteraceae bacterium]|nr:GFA family protein [Rhodanobacteraceae bacterium]